MSHDIFLSYSTKDKDTALRLKADLEQFYDVWIDRADIKGGTQWIKAIEQAVLDCTIFMILVTPNSNAAEWVARETLLATREGKYVLPVLFEDDLPFHIINLQYVDFRGTYDGGFRDLLEVLQTQLTPQDRARQSADQKLGAAMRAYVQGDGARCGSLLSQALLLDPTIANSVMDYWAAIRRPPSTDYAAATDNTIAIRETARLLSNDERSDQQRDANDWYRWQIAIDADAHVLQRIDHVQYRLHPTFQPNTQIVRSRDDHFALTRVGWGVFEIGVTVFFNDGTRLQGTYDLTFEDQVQALTVED